MKIIRSKCTAYKKTDLPDEFGLDYVILSNSCLIHNPRLIWNEEKQIECNHKRYREVTQSLFERYNMPVNKKIHKQIYKQGDDEVYISQMVSAHNQ